jgi:Tetratricopeptide repeat
MIIVGINLWASPSLCSGRALRAARTEPPPSSPAPGGRLREALEGRRAVLGPAHPDTLTSLHNLAEVYRAQGRHGEAERLYKEVLEGAQATLGPTRCYRVLRKDRNRPLPP